MSRRPADDLPERPGRFAPFERASRVVGWGPLTAALGVAAVWVPWRGLWYDSPACVATASAFVALWWAAGHAWRGWAGRAWRPGKVSLSTDVGCSSVALIQGFAAEGLRAADCPGWGFVWAGAALFLAAGAAALRPRQSEVSSPVSSKLLGALGILMWPTQGFWLGARVGETGVGAKLGAIWMVAALLPISLALLGGRAGPDRRLQSGAFLDDLRLLWEAGFPRGERPRPAAQAEPLAVRLEVQADGPAAGTASQARPPITVGEPTLVESGSFRVDPEKALEKLSKFRLAEPSAFVLALFRASVAAGASKPAFETLEDGFRLRFDGRPLAPGVLADPLGALLTEELSGAEHELATGLLGVLAMPGCRMLAASGRGDGRRVVRVSATGSARSALVDSGEESLVEVRWQGGVSPSRVLGLLKSRVALAGLEWTIDGESQAADPPAPGPAGWWSPKGKSRALLLSPRRDIEGLSRVRFCKWGTVVDEERRLLTTEKGARGLPMPVDACVRDDSFALDISQTNAVRDIRYRVALKDVRLAYGVLVDWLAKEDERLWPKLSKAARPADFPDRAWRRLRRAVGFPAAQDLAKDVWDRSVRQWLRAASPDSKATR